MKHKPASGDFEDFESLLQETGSVVSNGGGSHGDPQTPLEEEEVKPSPSPPQSIFTSPAKGQTVGDLASPLVLSPIG